MNILPLFPTPIAQIPNFISSKERLQLIDSIKKNKHHIHKSISGDGYSTHGSSKIFNVLDRKIKNRMQVALDEYNQTCGNHLSEIDCLWSNIQHSGSILLQHCHPTSAVSGALYVNVGEDCRLYFHNPNPYVYYLEKDKYTHYNFENYWISVKNCLLVLFPSWLRHGNDNVVNKMNDRMVVSFNSLLQQK